MVDPIINQAAQQAAEQAANDAAQPNPADLDDAERFADALASNSQSPDNLGVDPSRELLDVQPKPSLGEAILNGIEQAKADYDFHVEAVNTQMQAAGDSPMSVQDAMKLQFELMQMNIQQEMTTKVADKTSQGVQTLFRNQ